MSSESKQKIQLRVARERALFIEDHYNEWGYAKKKSMHDARDAQGIQTRIVRDQRPGRASPDEEGRVPLREIGPPISVSVDVAEAAIPMHTRTVGIQLALDRYGQGYAPWSIFTPSNIGGSSFRPTLEERGDPGWDHMSLVRQDAVAAEQSFLSWSATVGNLPPTGLEIMEASGVRRALAATRLQSWVRETITGVEVL